MSRTKEEVLATEIASVPGMTPTMCRRIIRDFVDDYVLTVGHVIKLYPWEVPAQPLADFVLEHGLTRIDWHALPYDELKVMNRLRVMHNKDIEALPILVFGFITRASRWVYRACGIGYGQPGHGQPVESATISQFLKGERDVIELGDRNSTSFQRVTDCLRSLGFESPMLESGHASMIRLVHEKYGLSLEQAVKLVGIAIEEGWIPKNRLA